MQATNTLFQAPKTIIYDGMPVDGYEGHYMEIVIASMWEYRVVWCVEIFEDGLQYTHLYRLEKRRKLSDEDKKLVGVHWTAYGLYDVDSRLSAGVTSIYYSKGDALLALKEKVKIREHNLLEQALDSLLDDELETIDFFISDYAYCNECAKTRLFKGCKYYMLQSLRTLSFTDIDGFSYGIHHEMSGCYADSDQYENGLNCKGCDTELMPPLETYEDDEVLDEDETVTGYIAGDTVDNSDYDTQLPNDFDAMSM